MTDEALERSAYAEFLEAHPDYAQTAVLDALRASDYGRLDTQKHVYLDYTGGSLYGESQVREHAELLKQQILGNPHSSSLCSTATTSLVEQTRRHILSYFNTSPDVYTAIFTANATAALRLVGEAFPFAPRGRLLLAADSHNSLNGVREFAAARGATIEYAPLTMPELRLDMGRLEGLLERVDQRRANLFGFPAQSNFSGVKHPLRVIQDAQSRGWSVLLDAAAFVPTNRLDLSLVQPDFVCLSFYKMFGYPTGVGCLLVSHRGLAKLSRPWFSGGTVNFATVQLRKHLLTPGEAGFEDGTLNYLAIPAVDVGLRLLERIGVDIIQTGVRCLTAWLLDRLMTLRHSNGRHMVRIYGPATTDMRGGTLTMNFYDPEGHLLDYRRVEELAALQRISLRTGCFCNPGTVETAEGLTEDDILAGLSAGHDLTLARFVEIVKHRGGKSAGAIRASLGLASNFPDVYRFLQFASELRDQTRMTLGGVSFDVEACRVIRDGS